MIDILMSTYNGAEFLSAQIDSILAQDFRDFRLVIRDDGSTDDTIALLQNYMAKDARVVLTEDDRGNLGARHSFFKLIEKSNAGFIMLSDQDDVWLPDKISRTLSKIKEMTAANGIETPLAVFTDLTVVTATLDMIDKSFWNYQRLDPDISQDWKKLLAQNVVAGCTLMINRVAKSVVLPFSIPEMMHDHWIAARMARHGKIAFLAEPTVLYRQHGRNVEGAKNVGISYFGSKASGLLGSISVYRKAAATFGGTTAYELLKNKILLNLKRLT